MNEIIQNEIKIFKKVQLLVFVLPFAAIAISVLTSYLINLTPNSQWVHAGTQVFFAWVATVPTVLNLLLVATIAAFILRRLNKLQEYSQNQGKEFLNLLDAHRASVKGTRVWLIVFAVLMSPWTLLVFGSSLGTTFAGLIIACSLATHLAVIGALNSHTRRISPKQA